MNGEFLQYEDLLPLLITCFAIGFIASSFLFFYKFIQEKKHIKRLKKNGWVFTKDSTKPNAFRVDTAYKNGAVISNVKSKQLDWDQNISNPIIAYKIRRI